jgi:hypothetical protein
VEQVEEEAKKDDAMEVEEEVSMSAADDRATDLAASREAEEDEGEEERSSPVLEGDGGLVQHRAETEDSVFDAEVDEISGGQKRFIF